MPDENPRFINSGFEPRPAQPADRSARRDDPSRLLFTWRPGPARLPDENPRFINSGFEPGLGGVTAAARPGRKRGPDAGAGPKWHRRFQSTPPTKKAIPDANPRWLSKF